MEFEKNFKWCFTCDAAYLDCPECGNNSCNGGCGQNIDGKPKPYWCETSGFNDFLANLDYPIRPTKDQVIEQLDNYNKQVIVADIYIKVHENYKKRLREYCDFYEIKNSIV